MTDQFLFRSLRVFVVQVTGIAVLFLVHTMLSRILGVYQYGIFSYVVSWLQLLLAAAMFGMRSTLIRYVASLAAKADWKVLRHLLQFSLRLVFLNACGVALLLSGLVWLLRDQMAPEMQTTFYIGACVLPFWSVFERYRFTLQGFKQAAWSQFPDYVLRPILLLGGFLLLRKLVGGESNAVLAGWALLGSVVLSVVVLHLVLRRALPRGLTSDPEQDTSTNWWKVAFPFFILAWLYFFMLQADVLLLGLLRSPEEVGLFSAASKLAQIVGFGINAVSVLLAPLLSEYYAAGDFKNLQNALTRCALLSAVFTLPAALLLFLFGHQALALFGLEFVEGYRTLLLLTTVQGVIALAGPLVFVLSMTEHERSAVKVYALVSVIEVLLGFLLIPEFGAEGAALSTLITTIVWCILLRREIRNKLDVEPSVVSLFRRN